MAQRLLSPAYFADTEGSDSEQPDMMDRPSGKSKSSHKSGKNRRVLVHTPSEEDLHESGRSFHQSRRPSIPYATTRHSKSSECENPAHNIKCDEKPAETAPSHAAPLGPQVYNNPAGSSAPAGVNHIFVHHDTAAPSGYYTNTPQYQTLQQLPGQSATSFIINPAANTVAAMPQQFGYYQNAAQPQNGALHFQPQVPDTSLGPMQHFYHPQVDGQAGAYVRAPGIALQGVAGPLQAGYATAPMMPIPVINQQPYPGQPMAIGGGGNLPASQPMMMPMAGGGMGGGVPPGQPVLVNGGAAPMMPGVYPPMNAIGLGQARGQAAPAYMANPEVNEPQDFKPADDNPSRMYMVRQLDGAYIQMPRATIDSFGDGARWYCTDDGVFYAVRLDA